MSDGSTAWIVGVGAVTPVGSSSAASAAAVRAGIGCAVDHPFLLDRECAPLVVARVDCIDSRTRGIARFRSLAELAAEEALEVLSGLGPALPRIRVLLALPEERPGVPVSLAETLQAQLFRAFAVAPCIESIRAIPAGHAAGIVALEQARRDIAADPDLLCIVGGVDSYLDADTLAWLESREQLHGPHYSWGFRPGEAAGFLALCSASLARRLELPCRLAVVAAGLSEEPYPLDSGGICIGQGLTAAYRMALSGVEPNVRVSHTLCDMNGEPYRADEFGFAMLRTSAHFEDEAGFSTPAQCWGDVGAASIPLFAMLFSESVARGYAPGPATLVCASSQHGLRGACILLAPPR